MSTRKITKSPIYRPQFLIEPSGGVQVWDKVAGHYTRCHSMSDAEVATARKVASEQIAWARDYAGKVMTPDDVEGFNLEKGTSYSTKDELIRSESDRLFAFYFLDYQQRGSMEIA